MPYGSRKYGKTSKPVEQLQTIPALNSTPTFVCSKCKQVRQLPPGHIDVFITVENKTKMGYKICWGCSVLLETWIKG